MRGNRSTSDTTSTRSTMPVIAISLITVVSAVVGLNVALPEIARATGATQTDLTWIIDSYTVVFAALLFFAGALGDRFGRRRLLAIGLVIFGLAALGGSFATTPTQLIAVRALMGLGAAAVMPTTLSVITTSFPEEERPRAIGAWVGMAGAGAIIGLLFTATLLSFFSWPSIFWLNVVLATIGVIGTLARIPESVEAHPPALDIVGGLLSLVGVGGVVFGIIEGPERGWGDGLTLGALVVGLAALAVFVLWEFRRADPLLDPRLFRQRGFSTGSLAIAATFFCWFGLIFSIIQYLQFVVGYSAIRAVAALLPIPFVLLPTARNAPKLAARIGIRRTVPVGLLLLAAGLGILSRVGVEMSYPIFTLGLAIAAAGMGLSGTPSTSAVTSSLPPSKQGVASAMNDTARELGAALGIAVLGSALAQTYRDAMLPAIAGLPERASQAILGSVAFTQAPELALLGPRGQQLASLGRQAFVDGIGAAMTIAAALAAVLAVVVFVSAPRHHGEPSA